MEHALQVLMGNGLGVDIALGFIALESLYLLGRAPKTGRPTAAINLVFALGPGICLMLALRCALTQTGLIWIAFWLVMSLPLHIADLARRKF